MWGLFRSKPTCPIHDDVRQWIDERFAWLQEELGEARLRSVRVVLPNDEFFPDTYQHREEDAQRLLNRVAGYMGVDHQRLKLYFFNSEEERPGGANQQSYVFGAAGFYHRDGPMDENGQRLGVIGIDVRKLEDPEALIATLAHEIGHEILIGQGRVTEDDEDHEQLTDLLTVALGMGIFNANATIRDRGFTSGLWVGSRTSRQGYLDQRMFGYALAKFAFARGELKPSWLKHVRPDVRLPLKQSLRLLAEA